LIAGPVEDVFDRGIGTSFVEGSRKFLLNDDILGSIGIRDQGGRGKLDPNIRS